MNPQFEELACFYVLDRLDARERAAFEARLLHDRELAALVHQLESALARRIHALPQHEPLPGLLARIEARIDRLPTNGASAPARPVLPLWASIARWGIAAVIAVGVGTLAVQSLRRAPVAIERPMVIFVGLDSLRSTRTELPVPERSQNADVRFVQLASLAEQFWEKPENLPVHPGPSGGRGRGYALFDPGSNQGFIAIQQLPVVEQGQRYHLWILDTVSGLVRDAGILPLAGAHDGLYFFSVTPADGAKSGGLDFFVTSEDTAAPQANPPHGKVVLGARRI